MVGDNIRGDHGRVVDGGFWTLLDTNDEVAQRLRQSMRFYVVPNMNPDGGVEGICAVGANLNREWPIRRRNVRNSSAVRNKMDETVDFCIDVHGDEALPYKYQRR